MLEQEMDARELELERRDEEVRLYSRHRIGFALGMAFVFAAALLAPLSRWLIFAGFVAAGVAWIASGSAAWQSGLHMFGGGQSGGFGRFVITHKARGGARVVAVVLFTVGVLCFGAAIGSLR